MQEFVTWIFTKENNLIPEITARIMSLLDLKSPRIEMVSFIAENKEGQIAAIIQSFGNSPLIKKSELTSHLFSDKQYSKLFKTSSDSVETIESLCDRAKIFMIRLATGLYFFNCNYRADTGPIILEENCIISKGISIKKYDYSRLMLLNVLNLKYTQQEFYSKDFTKYNMRWVCDCQSFFNAAYDMIEPTQIGVDTEGDYKVDSIVELIQIECNKVVYIFDMMMLRKLPEYPQMSLFMQGLFDCKAIQKVFFDGRGDVLSIHSNFGVCVKNMYDVQAAHMVIISLKNPSNKANPGLNDSLTEFKASHGKNYLKEKMHEIFNDSEISYYSMRPLDINGLIYSGLDVIDLVEIKDKQLAELHTLLNKLDLQTDQSIEKTINTATVYDIALHASHFYKMEACKDLKAGLIELSQRK